MAKRVEYQIVGRYMSGKEVIAYHLYSSETGKGGRYTKEQVCLLVGRGQVVNCDGQIYKDKVILRGIGVSLDSLPVQQDDGTITRTGSIGRVAKGTDGGQAMEQVLIQKAIINGRYTVGYIVSNSAGRLSRVSREQAFELAKNSRIGNARYQESNGKPIIRGVGINLNEIESISLEDLLGGE